MNLATDDIEMLAINYASKTTLGPYVLGEIETRLVIKWAFIAGYKACLEEEDIRTDE